MNKISVLHYMYMAGFVNDDGKWDSRPISQQEDNFKTFAELIVKECARVAINADLEDVDGGDSHVLQAASEQIKQHFGVE